MVRVVFRFDHIEVDAESSRRLDLFLCQCVDVTHLYRIFHDSNGGLNQIIIGLRKQSLTSSVFIFFVLTQKGKVIGIFHLGERAHLSEKKNTHFALYSVPNQTSEKSKIHLSVQFFSFILGAPKKVRVRAFGRAEKSESLR
jgi:hypothetical protein